MRNKINVRQVLDEEYEELQHGLSIGGSTKINFKWALFQQLGLSESYGYSVYFGQALHTATLEPEKFAEYTNKSKLKEVAKSCLEKKELPPYQYLLIKQIATYLNQNMDKFDLGEIMAKEQGFVCNDFDIPLRAKFDILSMTADGRVIITDIKTTSKSIRLLPYVIRNRYLHQAKLYLFLLENYLECRGMLYKDVEFQFIFVGNIVDAEPFVQRIVTDIKPYTAEEVANLVKVAKAYLNLTTAEELDKYVGDSIPPVLLDFHFANSVEFSEDVKNLTNFELEHQYIDGD